MLCLWHRPAAATPIRLLAWELPCAMGVALKKNAVLIKNNYIAYSAIFISLTVPSQLLIWCYFRYLKKILKEGLQKYIYPPETTEDFETENAFPPIEVMLEVHENVIFFEDPMVAS